VKKMAAVEEDAAAALLGSVTGCWRCDVTAHRGATVVGEQRVR
jgi:hypothetical protein